MEALSSRFEKFTIQLVENRVSYALGFIKTVIGAEADESAKYLRSDSEFVDRHLKVDRPVLIGASVDQVLLHSTWPQIAPSIIEFISLVYYEVDGRRFRFNPALIQIEWAV